MGLRAWTVYNQRCSGFTGELELPKKNKCENYEWFDSANCHSLNLNFLKVNPAQFSCWPFPFTCIKKHLQHFDLLAHRQHYHFRKNICHSHETLYWNSSKDHGAFHFKKTNEKREELDKSEGSNFQPSWEQKAKDRPSDSKQAEQAAVLGEANFAIVPRWVHQEELLLAFQHSVLHLVQGLLLSHFVLGQSEIV